LESTEHAYSQRIWREFCKKASRKNILIASADTIRLSADIFIAFSNAIRKNKRHRSIA